MTVYTGHYNATTGRIAIIVSRFNAEITTNLVAGAQDTLLRHNVSSEQIDVVWVPGAFEIPGMVHRLLALNKYDGVITLGAVIRGETDHYQYISGETVKGISQLALTSSVPVVFGVLTTDTVEQAQARAGGKAGNEGSAVAEDLLEMMDVNAQVQSR
ncbi:6,7-dimethyl-8-ribityllumazine synthase [Levilactobacillus bambusae]|uniref:6,7-dimethyl-8-ribityllumazine synthase n=1 Tax=Levilactobacillus bambusae TaxID=2024736 RepID=A0A2V1N1Z0_9LACO|nr:6,7-dimethyl-8-ribityllumazine synthase [Levilactobacillus bambusae]PWG00336.1 6,7-dimethyl-8-ribityllumazine synthase [Levilactobacillus bambusae]